nr:hypothetical protein [Pedobacter sp. ASV19]
MLQAIATKSGTGVSIFGDYADLSSLYDTVHHIADALDEENKYQRGQHMLLMNFAYEIRHAYQGTRLIQRMSFDDEQSFNYYGFQLVWTDVLIFVSVLRENAGFLSTGRLNQANLYLLEYVLEQALSSYDATGAAEIIPLLGRGLNIDGELSFIIYQTVHVQFVGDRSGKARFRKIPHLLRSYFSSWSPEHKQMLHSLTQSAKVHGCEIHELEFSDFPEIKW